jgi:hypothetical protein
VNTFWRGREQAGELFGAKGRPARSARTKSGSQIIGRAVVEGHGDVRVSGGDVLAMIENETGAAAAEAAGIEIAQAFALFVPVSAVHADNDGTIGERVSGKRPMAAKALGHQDEKRTNRDHAARQWRRVAVGGLG